MQTKHSNADQVRNEVRTEHKNKNNFRELKSEMSFTILDWRFQSVLQFAITQAQKAARKVRYLTINMAHTENPRDFFCIDCFNLS